MSDPITTAPVERFHATNGRVSGYLGLGVGVIVLGLALSAGASGSAPGIAIVALLGLLLVWVVMLRAALWVTREVLVLRGLYRTDHVPLASIDRVEVAQVTTVTAAGVRYQSPVVGYSARQTVRQRNAARKSGSTPTATDAYQVFVEERITSLAGNARDQLGSTPAGAPRRSWAWPELVGTVLLVLTFLVWLLLL